MKDTIDSLESDLTDDLTVDLIKQASPEQGFASTYYLTQGGVQVGAKINIAKDKMLRSASIVTVGATPTEEETQNNLTTGDSYILLVVNTSDNDATTNLIIPISDIFDLQTGDNTTITINANGVISIKEGYVESVINDYLDAFIAGL